jgi:uncharacterized protein YjlB
MPTIPRALTIEEELFVDDGSVPNNPRLPLIVYRGALQTGGKAAEACVTLFHGNGWGGAWRHGIYARHHYHSTAHEVLGIVAGSVRVRLGGESGKTMDLRAGDVVVIPAGVAHKSERASPDLVVVGAYPQGQSPDMRTPGTADLERTAAQVAAVPLPRCDPVCGMQGPLLERWRGADRS